MFTNSGDQHAQQRLPVGVIHEDFFASVTAGGDTVERTGEFDDEATDLGRRLVSEEAKGNLIRNEAPPVESRALV